MTDRNEPFEPSDSERDFGYGERPARQLQCRTCVAQQSCRMERGHFGPGRYTVFRRSVPAVDCVPERISVFASQCSVCHPDLSSEHFANVRFHLYRHFEEQMVSRLYYWESPSLYHQSSLRCKSRRPVGTASGSPVSHRPSGV